MTREQIASEYQVDEHGVIRSPGKFEGEMIYAPYFYDAMLNGMADETEYDGDTPIDVFAITDDDRKMFPELGDIQVLHCYESEQGFFFCKAS